MCGIVGYVGNKQALGLLLNGLKALEYRGYDSAGFAIFSNDNIQLQKAVGPVINLETKVGNVLGNMGIAHTRWATHGVPSEKNSHPHTDCAGNIFAVHNGIIENYKELKTYLISRGHTFSSDTDTEVIPHLIEDFMRQGEDFKTALFHTLKMIRGAYALAIIHKSEPGKIYAAKLSSPLVVGIGAGENFLASDPSALIGNTKNIAYLKDYDIAEISANQVVVTDLEQKPIDVQIETLEWSLERTQKGNFPHFMLKEIFEGPDTVRAAFSGRIKENEVKLGGLEQVKDQIKDIKRIIISACGTSYYAGMVGEYLFEEIANIPTEVHFASEFRYRKEPFSKDTAAIFISQSGETADTLGALRKAKDAKLLSLGIVNAVGSTIARETNAGVYNHAGPEIGVASTKAFLSQITILTLMAYYFSALKDSQLLTELQKIPEKISSILEQAERIQALAEKYQHYKNFVFLGRRYNYPTALEGALKLKEISYIHAEGYGAGELKHGPIAMINEHFPTIAIVPRNGVSEKMYSNLEEIKSRKGPVLAIATQGDTHINSIANDVIYIPETIEPLEPLLAVVPLQLFAYYMGTTLGHNVDKPRNLAKSVTVE